MKKCIALALSIFLYAITFAQDTATVYFDHAGKPCKKITAFIWGKEYKLGNAWVLNTYTPDEALISTTTYRDEECQAKEGQQILYSDRGKQLQLLTYSGNKLNGPFNYYYENGQKQMEGNYSMDKKTGDWIGYYPSGKIAAKAHYEDNNQLFASFVNEDGSPRAALDSFYRPVSFPGGDKAWIRYLSKTLRYPQDAQDYEKQGRVTIRFTVKADGKAENFAIDWSMQPLLEKEALRVVSNAGDWMPAIIGGLQCDVLMKKSISFKLETN